MDGIVFLVVDLPDGSPGTMRLDATDVLAVLPVEPAGTVLSGDGVRALRRLVSRLRAAGDSSMADSPMGGGQNA